MVCRDRLALAFVVALLSGRPDASVARHHKSPAGDPPAAPPSSIASTSQLPIYDFSPDRCSSMVEFGFVSSHSTVVTEEMLPPSPAPSQAPTCDFATSNARGRYTSELNPCTFRFHVADESMEEMEFIEYHTSDLCTDENTIGHRSSSSPATSSTRGAAAASMSVKEYVKDFPDECVGDFTRCYSLEYHSKVVWEFLCDKEWKLPEGTTHISVDCTADKKLMMESALRERQQATQQRQQSMRTVYQLKFTNFAIIAGSCFFGILAIAHLIVKPMSQMMMSSLSLKGPQQPPHEGDGGSTVATGDTSSAVVVQQIPCLTNRTSSVSVDETSSRISSSMDGSFHLMGEPDDQATYLARMHDRHQHLNHLQSFHDVHSPPGTVSHPSAEHFHGSLQEAVQDNLAGSEAAMRPEVAEVSIPQESVHAVSCQGENEVPCEPSHVPQQEHHQARDGMQHGQEPQALAFERQVPADFDAIPIVAALPIQDDFGTENGNRQELPLRAQNVVACPEGL